MKRSAFAVLAVVLTLIFAVASAAADPHAERPTAGAPEVTTAAPADDASLGLLRAQAYVEQVNTDAFWSWASTVDAWLATLYVAPEPVVVTAPPAAAATGSPSTASAPSGGGGCASGGGALDGAPAYVIERESGGDYCAANPSGACGAYQIMGQTWNGYGGYASACDAPPAVQDEKARSMAACNWQPPNYCAG
jgi:hypothetical protein